MWYTSGEKKALDFIKNMNKYNKRLGYHALMTPHMMFHTCPWCSTGEIEKNCIQSQGTTYCAPPVKSALTGNEALRLGLTEICIYTVYKERNETQKWWDYMDAVYDCQASRFSQECTGRAMMQAKIDLPKIQICLLKEADIMRSEHTLWQNSGVVYNPAIVINNHVYRVFSVYLTSYRVP